MSRKARQNAVRRGKGHRLGRLNVVKEKSMSDAGQAKRFDQGQFKFGVSAGRLA